MEVQYTSDSSDSESRENKTIELSNRRLAIDDLEIRLKQLNPKPCDYLEIEMIYLHHNVLSSIPSVIVKFSNLKVLDISSNNLSTIPDFINQCQLVTFIAKNNKLTNESLPKSLFAKGGTIKEINLSGNQFQYFPEQLLELHTLKYLYLAGNQISSIPITIKRMRR